MGLGHTVPEWVESGAVFFITICCERRGSNQLCREDVGQILLDAVRLYHERHDWFCRLFILMPDHVHGLVAPARNKRLGLLIGDWKRYVARRTGIQWQKNFIDHRLRSDESLEEKAHYIHLNPVRAGLAHNADEWPYRIQF